MGLRLRLGLGIGLGRLRTCRLWPHAAEHERVARQAGVVLPLLSGQSGGLAPSCARDAADGVQWRHVAPVGARLRLRRSEGSRSEGSGDFGGAGDEAWLNKGGGGGGGGRPRSTRPHSAKGGHFWSCCPTQCSGPRPAATKYPCATAGSVPNKKLKPPSISARRSCTARSKGRCPGLSPSAIDATHSASEGLAARGGPPSARARQADAKRSQPCANDVAPTTPTHDTSRFCGWTKVQKIVPVARTRRRSRWRGGVGWGGA